MMRRRVVGTVTAATLVAGAALVAHSATAQPLTGGAADAAWPAHVTAPFLDTGLTSPTDLAITAAAAGVNHLTLAFVTDPAAGCSVSWGGGQSLDDARLRDQVAALRAKGGDVAVSVGGAAGTDPATSCTSAPALQAQYQRVVDAYSLKRLDLDIEGTALETPAATERRNTAVAALERANPQLQVSYTLPASPTGLGQSALAVLRGAKEAGADVTVVNLMTMDYGQPVSDMGAAAVDTATAAVGQLRTIDPTASEDATWSRIGITPMIGQNDSAGEQFTLGDAQTIKDLAVRHNIAELSMWSLSRDNGGCSGQTTASATCSGLTQDPWAFSRTLGAFGQN